jgi:hypothetical protein
MPTLTMPISIKINSRVGQTYPQTDSQHISVHVQFLLLNFFFLFIVDDTRYRAYSEEKRHSAHPDYAYLKYK